MMSLKRPLAIALVLLFTPSMLLAQKSLSDWSVIEKLKPGTQIIVTTKNGREFMGEKRQSTDDTLFMETSSAVQGLLTISLSRDEIAEVRKRKSRAFFPLIAAAIGIGVGAAIGSTADHPYSDDPGLGKLVGGVMGGAIGLGAGSFFGRTIKSKRIYVAP
jgi:hypothetical protein